jgi:HPt (histidine-containing phosphotransfer) domain-containing protein
MADAPKLVQRIGAAIEDKNAAQLEAAAHTLRGAVGYFTVKGPYLLTRSLERASRENDFETAARDYEELDTKMTQIFTTLSVFIDQLATTR